MKVQTGDLRTTNRFRSRSVRWLIAGLNCLRGLRKDGRLAGGIVRFYDVVGDEGRTCWVVGDAGMMGWDEAGTTTGALGLMLRVVGSLGAIDVAGILRPMVEERTIDEIGALGTFDEIGSVGAIDVA